MIYTNDETDKSIRRRNYILTVYVLPVLVVAVICLLVYWASTEKMIAYKETYYGFLISLTPAIFLYAYYKKLWKK